MVNLFGEQIGAEVCEVCGRPLSNPISVERGIGPVCSGKRYAGMHGTAEKQPEALAPYSLISFKYPYDNRKITCAVYVNVAGTYENSTVVVLAEPRHYEGMSVTNACEHIATEVVRKYGLNPHYCTWIEHYSAELDWRDKESFALINFNWKDGQASRPDWRHVTRETVEALMGRTVPAV